MFLFSLPSLFYSRPSIPSLLSHLSTFSPYYDSSSHFSPPGPGPMAWAVTGGASLVIFGSAFSVSLRSSSRCMGPICIGNAMPAPINTYDTQHDVITRA